MECKNEQAGQVIEKRFVNWTGNAPYLINRFYVFVFAI